MPCIKLFFPVFLIAIIYTNETKAQKILQNKKAKQVRYLSLEGTPLIKANTVNSDGDIHSVALPLIRMFYTKSKTVKGTTMLLPGGDYKAIKFKSQGKPAADFFNNEGFDVAMLDYTIADSSGVSVMSLTDAVKAYRLIKTKGESFGLHTNNIHVSGLASGGQLAAMLVQRLKDNEQPGRLILMSQSGLDTTLPGTVIHAIMPPLTSLPKLLVTLPASESKPDIIACREYCKRWIGYDGIANFQLTDSVTRRNKNDIIPFDASSKLKGGVSSFLSSENDSINEKINPAAIPVEGYNPKRHLAKLALVNAHKYDLIMLGNSITHNFEKPEYQAVWNQFFAPRNAINFGFSGYRTENILWNIENGQLNAQSPKVVVLEIGTNNIDEVHYKTRHTAGQLAGGIEAIVKLLQQKLPATKIIIMRSFPGCYGGSNPTSHREILERASDITSRLADGKNIFYCDVNHVFLQMDGSVNKQMLGDYLHPTPAGAKAWAKAMEPLLCQFFDDKSLDDSLPANTAIVPAVNSEKNSYSWLGRHAEVLRMKDSLNPEVVLIGNSITHLWGGDYPQFKYANGQLRVANGLASWAGLFSQYRVLNLGFGWDRTQNVLWRLDNGEIDGLHPRTVVIEIGTNNTSQSNSARSNTATEIVEGIQAVCARVRSKVPNAKIVLMALFPREKEPASPRRAVITQVNQMLSSWAKEQKITCINIADKMLAPDGTFLPGMMLDYTHPSDKGYQVWADAIRSIINQP